MKNFHLKLVALMNNFTKSSSMTSSVVVSIVVDVNKLVVEGLVGRESEDAEVVAGELGPDGEELGADVEELRPLEADEVDDEVDGAVVEVERVVGTVVVDLVVEIVVFKSAVKVEEAEAEDDDDFEVVVVTSVIGVVLGLVDFALPAVYRSVDEYEDDLEVLVGRVLADPVGAEDAKTLDTATNTLFGDGLEVPHWLHLVDLT